MNLSRALLILTTVVTCFLWSAHAQEAGQIHPALATNEGFVTALKGVDWECTSNSYKRVRFNADSIELLSPENKVTSTLKNVSILEPGVIRVDYSNGGIVVFVFSDDLRSFVIANMTSISELEIPGAAEPVKLPAGPESSPVELGFKDNPFWKAARLYAEKMEILDDGGTAFAENEGFAFYRHVLGVKLPDKAAGIVILSRHRPGGWYLGGRTLGTGVRTQGIGQFRPFMRSHMKDFALRSAHFNRHLLLSGQQQAAFAQERYALYNAGNVYGESSEAVLHALNEMGRLRGGALSFELAAYWHERAYAMAKELFSDNPAKLLEIGTDYAEAQADKGDFSGAKVTLAELQSLVPAEGDPMIPYAFYRAMGAAEFGLRKYAQALELFTANYQRCQNVSRMEGSELDSLMDLVAVYLALGQPLEAAARGSVAITRQEERKIKYPKFTFDTYKLSMVCTVLQKWPEAERFSAETNRRSSVTYMECARLLSLICQGKKTEAKRMAQNFSQRFSGGLDEIQIRRDIDAMILSLTKAAAEQTPQAVSELEQAWAKQVESLRNRPLQNYIFARVMVAAIASLKQ